MAEFFKISGIFLNKCNVQEKFKISPNKLYINLIPRCSNVIYVTVTFLKAVPAWQQNIHNSIRMLYSDVKYATAG